MKTTPKPQWVQWKLPLNPKSLKGSGTARLGASPRPASVRSSGPDFPAGVGAAEAKRVQPADGALSRPTSLRQLGQSQRFSGSAVARKSKAWMHFEPVIFEEPKVLSLALAILSTGPIENVPPVGYGLKLNHQELEQREF